MKQIRNALLRLVILFFLISFVSNESIANSDKPKKRPNIIIFIADDLGVTDIGPYGNKVVRTPHLDKFANESLLFTNTFAGSPTCGPSRSTLLTGLLPFRHGGHGNHSAVKEGTLSIVQYLQPLGYKVAIAGKLHVGPEASFPFERVSHSNVPEPGFEDKTWLRHDLNVDAVDKWLSVQKKDEPFVLIVADHSPHVIWPEKAEYSAEEIDIPSKHIDTYDTRKARARYYTDITKMDRNMGNLLSSLDKHGFDESLVLFTSDQGPQWAFGKWSLYDYGIQTPMLIRWPGTVKAAIQSDALVSQADILPTFIEIAGGKAPKNIDGISFMNVLKSGKDSNRKYVVASHTGDHQMNRSPARMVRTKRFKYILNLAPEIEFNTHMNKATDHDGGREYWPSWVEKARTDKHAKKVLNLYHHRPAEELYDVVADPQEMNNLINDPKQAAILKELRAQMRGWRKQQGDFETGPEKPSQKVGKKEEVPYVFLD
ncbi:MAG: sulfatase [Sphingobacteriaceae bacterium]